MRWSIAPAHFAPPALCPATLVSQLKLLNVAANLLSGTFPAQWASATAFRSLRRLTLQPGNACMAGLGPAGAFPSTQHFLVLGFNGIATVVRSLPLATTIDPTACLQEDFAVLDRENSAAGSAGGE